MTIRVTYSLTVQNEYEIDTELDENGNELPLEHYTEKAEEIAEKEMVQAERDDKLPDGWQIIEKEHLETE